MLISLLIATINRTDPLVNFLRSLETQHYKNFEVIIADQNPRGMLDSFIQEFLGKFPIHLKSVPPTGVSTARNAILSLAKGDIIAFPDDDCWYGEETLEKIVNTFIHHPSAGGIICAWSSSSDKQENKLVLTPSSRIDAFKGAGTIVQFYRKKAIHNILFDETLGPGTNLPYGCGEDTDFLLQVMNRGNEVLRSNEILVFHPLPNLFDPKLPVKAYSYGLGRMYLLNKHKFPLWFKLANVFFPLVCMLKEGRPSFPYRKAMFLGRIKGLFSRK